jgi:hypothetical protein
MCGAAAEERLLASQIELPVEITRSQLVSPSAANTNVFTGVIGWRSIRLPGRRQV